MPVIVVLLVQSDTARARVLKGALQRACQTFNSVNVLFSLDIFACTKAGIAR
jgi:hypothetical protein